MKKHMILQDYSNEAYRQIVSRMMVSYDRIIKQWATNEKQPYFSLEVATTEGDKPTIRVGRWGYIKRPPNSHRKRFYLVNARDDWKLNIKIALFHIVKDWGQISVDIDRSEFKPILHSEHDTSHDQFYQVLPLFQDRLFRHSIG